MGSSSCRNIYSFASSFFFFSLFLSLSAHAQSTLRSSQSIIDGDTLISSNEIFELGFFSPGSSKNRYVGIWYYNISAKSVVWIANRDNPLTNSSGVFSIESNGNLIISDGRRNVFWSTNTTSNSSVSAVLENTGNLVLSTDSIDNSSRVLWQSFDNPTDTFLPSMQIGLNLRTGHRDIFTSWKSLEDPSPGNVTIGIDPLGSAQIFMWRDSKPVWRSGDWNGGGFTGVPDMVPLYFYGFSFTNSGEEGSRYFTYSVYNNSRVRFVPSPEGIVEQFSWNEESGVWDVIWYQPSNECEIYGKCGPFGICNVLDSPICSCLEGFEPRNGEEWKMENWSGGCVRRTELGCGGNSSSGGRDGFLRIGEVKSPDKSYWRVGVDEEDCEVFCLNNCTCWAYAYVSGIGCMHWGGDLVDIQLFSGLGGNDLFVRLASSELGGKSKISKGGKSKISKSVIIIVVIVGVIFSATGIYILCRFKAKFKGLRNKNEIEAALFDLGTSGEISGPADHGEQGKQRNGPELALFNFNYVEAATDNFLDANKLGQGGFGAVYKGKLPGGQEIAVKRLSKRSVQGIEEFKNEVTLIVKLQHRNLVRLLGCCIQGEEKMLLYEYMPNKSLDSFIFDPTKQGLLDWKKRFNIIEGIARGLLYLHRDSRLRIIHRDLKASNILLDEEMNPKISDFGMAKIFGGNQNEANTNRVVGTYGYMAPEYAMGGLFSVKSDVYSFGVLLLEIVSGKKNTSFHNSEHYLNLLEYVWKLWKENKAMELIDPSIGDSYLMPEVLRCMHVGLLCVQDHAIDRPTMSSVVSMLESGLATQPMPSQPTFSMSHNTVSIPTKIPEHVSTNDVTMSVIRGR